MEPNKISELVAGHDRIDALLAEVEQIRTRADRLLVDGFIIMTECRAAIEGAKGPAKPVSQIPCRYPEPVLRRSEGKSSDWTSSGPIFWPIHR